MERIGKLDNKHNWTNRGYHIQYRKYVQHKSVKMSYSSTQFKAWSFFVLHAKPHVVRGFSKHYHLRLDPKLGSGKYEIRLILCAFIA